MKQRSVLHMDLAFLIRIALVKVVNILEIYAKKRIVSELNLMMKMYAMVMLLIAGPQTLVTAKKIILEKVVILLHVLGYLRTNPIL